MSATIIFILGALSGSIVTFAYLSVLLRNGDRSKFSKISDYNERSLEALQERNRISERQLDLQREALNYQYSKGGHGV